MKIGVNKHYTITFFMERVAKIVIEKFQFEYSHIK